METKSSPKQPWCLCLWLTGLVLASPARTHAQDPFPTPTPIPDPLAGVPVQVLDQQQVTIGTHTITFNRITPPVFPAATPTPQATPSPKTTNRAPQTVPAKRTASRPPQTRAQKTTRSPRRDGTGDGKAQYKVLLLSATVYDHQFTEVRWPDGIEPTLRAYVNLDFRYFTAVTNLETADAAYGLMFAWGDDTADSLTRAGQPYPNFSSVSAGHAGYQVFAGDTSAHPDAVAALNALCAYYDAHSAQMVAAYNQQQADNAARQQWLQAHPPVQPDTVINYWPTQNSVFLNPAH